MKLTFGIALLASCCCALIEAGLATRNAIVATSAPEDLTVSAGHQQSEWIPAAHPHSFVSGGATYGHQAAGPGPLYNPYGYHALAAHPVQQHHVPLQVAPVHGYKDHGPVIEVEPHHPHHPPKKVIHQHHEHQKVIHQHHIHQHVLHEHHLHKVHLHDLHHEDHNIHQHHKHIEHVHQPIYHVHKKHALKETEEHRHQQTHGETHEHQHKVHESKSHAPAVYQHAHGHAHAPLSSKTPIYYKSQAVHPYLNYG